jgi:UDP-glucuronate 4-epimerase
MSVLVTGVAGFVGSHLAEALLDRGQAVVGLDSFDAFYAREIKEGNLQRARDQEDFELVEGDIRDPDIERRLPADLHAIVHLAARVGVRPSVDEPSLYSEVNVAGTSRMLQLARDREVSAFLFASSSSVYGNNEKVPFSETDPVDHPISPYAATKKAGELLCHAATHLDGISTVCTRLFTVYGPRQRPDLAIHRFARLMRLGQPIPLFGDGSSSRDYTFIRDIVSGLLGGLDWALAEPGRHEVVNLGESRTVTLNELVTMLAEELGTEPVISRLPTQPGDVRRTYADVSKAKALFGYDPKVEFREGLREFIHWLEREPRPLASTGTE